MNLYRVKQNFFTKFRQFNFKSIQSNLNKINFSWACLNTRLNLSKLSNWSEPVIFEYFFLLESIFLGKPYVNSFLRKYQQSSVELSIDVRKSSLLGTLELLNFFSFSLFRRRSMVYKCSFDVSNNLVFNMKDINCFPFMSSVFYKWSNILNLTFYNFCAPQMLSFLEIRGLVLLVLTFWGLPI